jgi:hypothetical protein
LLIILIAVVYVYRNKLELWWEKEFPYPPSTIHFYPVKPVGPAPPPSYQLYIGQATDCGNSCELPSPTGKVDISSCEDSCTKNGSCNQLEFTYDGKCILKNAPVGSKMVNASSWTAVKQ